MLNKSFAESPNDGIDVPSLLLIQKVLKLVVKVPGKPSIDDRLLEAPLIAEFGSRYFPLLCPCVNRLRLQAEVLSHLLDGHDFIGQLISPWRVILLNHPFSKMSRILLFIIVYLYLLWFKSLKDWMQHAANLLCTDSHRM